MNLKYEDWKKQHREEMNKQMEDRLAKFRERRQQDFIKIEQTFLELCKNSLKENKIAIPIVDLLKYNHFLDYSSYFPDEAGEKNLSHCIWLAKNWFNKDENKEKLARLFNISSTQYIYTRVTPKLINVHIKTYRKANSIKVECTFSERSVILRAVHDIPNGSAINVEGENLTDALEKLAQQIRNTNLKDKIWQSDRIK